MSETDDQSSFQDSGSPTYRPMNTENIQVTYTQLITPPEGIKISKLNIISNKGSFDTCCLQADASVTGTQKYFKEKH